MEDIFELTGNYEVRPISIDWRRCIDSKSRRELLTGKIEEFAVRAEIHKSSILGIITNKGATYKDYNAIYQSVCNIIGHKHQSFRKKAIIHPSVNASRIPLNLAYVPGIGIYIWR